MTQYYDMLFDLHREYGEHLDVPRLPGEESGDHTRFLRPGLVVVEHPLNVPVVEAGEPVDMHMPMNLWIVTPAVGLLFEQIAGRDEVQRIPCTTDDGRQMELLHPLLHLDCLDLSRCQGVKYRDPREIRMQEAYGALKPQPPFVKYIAKIAIQTRNVQGHHFFRLRGYEIVTIVSDGIRKEIQSRGVSGVTFRAIA